MILPKGTSLYRYDTKQPPKDWSVDFHEYEYPEMGIKNKIGSFFFFDNKEDSCRTCKNDKGYKRVCYLTTCETTCDVNLLDIRSESVMGIINILQDDSINIVDEKFKTYSCEEPQSMSNIKRFV